MTELKPVKVYLEGRLGQRLGKVWELYVSSPGEAIRAINANTKGALERFLKGEGANKYYKIALQERENIIGGEAEINNPSGQSNIYIMPAVKGSGKFINFIAAAVLIVVGIYFKMPFLVKMGVALLITGAIQLLTPMPKDESSEEDQRQSGIFQGNTTTILQGTSVGLVYGRALVAPMPISISINNTDQSINGITTESLIIQYFVSRGARVTYTSPGGNAQAADSSSTDFANRNNLVL